MKPQPWSSGDPITAQRLNSITQESLKNRRSQSFGPGNSFVGDGLGAVSSHHSKPSMHLCIAEEDFTDNQYTDTYTTLDKVPSGKCLLMRLNQDTGEYEKEISFEPFRVWDPFAALNNTKSKSKGDVFQAFYNKDNQRLEATPDFRLTEGLMVACLGQGWYEIELAKWEVEPKIPGGSGSYYDDTEECDICTLVNLVPDPNATSCGTKEVHIDHPRPTGLGMTVYAHDARRLPLKDGGHVRMMKTHTSKSGEPLYAIISGEYKMLAIANPDYECCDGEVVQTGCTYYVVEGVECHIYTKDCPS